MFLDGVSISDDANALTTLRQTANPGFWWYISSHLHGTASPPGPASKTAGPSPMPMSMPMSIPLSMPISMPMSIPMPMSMPGRMQVPGSVSDADDIDVVQRSSTPIASSPRVPASEPSEFSEPIEPVEQSPPRGVCSGSGAGLSSKTLNRFLRGKLLRLPTRIKPKVANPLRLWLGYTNGFLNHSSFPLNALSLLTTTQPFPTFTFFFHPLFLSLLSIFFSFDVYTRHLIGRLLNGKRLLTIISIHLSIYLYISVYLYLACLSAYLRACLFAICLSVLPVRFIFLSFFLSLLNYFISIKITFVLFFFTCFFLFLIF